MISEIIKLIIWPIVVVIFFLVFRKQIGKLIYSLKLKEILIGDKFKAVFGKQFKAIKEKKENQNQLFEELYKKMTGAQLNFLLLLRESMKFGGKGMDCGWVSQYFQNIIKSKTDRYDGWITPFITAYLQENELVSVADNFYSLNKIGNDYLIYIEEKKYSIHKKEL